MEEAEPGNLKEKVQLAKAKEGGGSLVPQRVGWCGGGGPMVLLSLCAHAGLASHGACGWLPQPEGLITVTWRSRARDLLAVT